MHINIVSIQKNIDELRQLLSLLDYKFDIIGLTETRLNEEPLINIDIEGYSSPELVNTDAVCGGVALYINKSLDYIKRDDLSYGSHEIGETVFLEIVQKRSKNVLVGCHYRHHTDLNKFNSTYLEYLTKKLSEQNNKPCILMGDFNVNLLNYDEHKDTENFYDILSSSSFQPLILQPTRVTSSISTLIDNIFIDQLGIKSTGGNIVTSISDHFPQFALVDLKISKHDLEEKYHRDFKNFNDREFEEEMITIPWQNLLNEKTSDEGVKFLFAETNKIFDCMASMKKTKRKKRKNPNKPWITKGILKSIRSKQHAQ